RCLQLLSRHDVGLPPTVYTRQADHIPDCIERVEGPPVVVKLLQGTQGIGVVLAESQMAASSVIEAFHGLEQEILIQKFIREANASPGLEGIQKTTGVDVADAVIAHVESQVSRPPTPVLHKPRKAKARKKRPAREAS